MLSICSQQVNQKLQALARLSIDIERNNQYDLIRKNHLQLPRAKTTSYGIEHIEHIQYRDCFWWFTLTTEVKDSNTITEFKREIKIMGTKFLHLQIMQRFSQKFRAYIVIFYF